MAARKPPAPEHGARARFRRLSLLFFCLLLLCGAAVVAAHSAAQAQALGVSAAYPAPVRGAESLRLGINVALEQYGPQALDARLAGLSERGITQVRQEFRWADLEPERGRYDWSISDRVVSAAQRRDVAVLAVLNTTPVWARAPSGSAQAPPTATQPPERIADFAAFAGAFAQRYGNAARADGQPLIIAYQVWDEPNLSAAWGDGLINPARYLAMLRAAGAAIRSAHASATIMLAGLAPTVESSGVNLAPQLYLRRLYELGGQDAFDLVAAKPFGFDFPPDDRRVDPGVLNFSHVILMRDEMVAHGDAGKALWFTQFGWNALPPGWSGSKSIWGDASAAEQADYTRRAVQRAAAEWPWVGGMFLHTLQPAAQTNDPQWGFAALDQAGEPRPVLEAYTAAASDAALAPRAQWFAVQQPAARAERPRYGPNPLAVFTDGWRFGELGADIPQREGAAVRIRFNGDRLALIVRRDNYRAYTFVTVDGQPANRLPVEPRGAYLIMTSPDLQPRVETIEVAGELGPGPHTADISVDRGWNQWALIGWSSAAPSGDGVLTTAIAILAGCGAALSLLGLIATAPRAGWRELASQVSRARPLAWQAVAAALLFWLTASLTWAQDAAIAYRNLGTPANVVVSAAVSAVAFWSPVFVVSLLALAALFVLILLRLDLGLMLLAFFIPFYILPQRLFERAFSMVELLTLMCAVAWLARLAGRALSPGARSRAGLPRFRITLLDAGVAALVGVSALSAAQAQFQVEAFRELRVIVVEPALVYLMLRTSRLESGQLWRIADGFVLGGLAIAAIGLVNYAQGNVFAAESGLARIRSIFGSPNNDALYLERVFAVLLAGALYSRESTVDSRKSRSLPLANGRRWGYALALAPVTVALVLSASRGALLFGAPAAVIVVLFLGGGRWRRAALGLAGAAALALLVLASGVAAPLLSGTRFANALDFSSGTGFFRSYLWQSAAFMWLDHPILGVGPDNFLYAYRGRYILPAAWQEPGLSHPHNIILDFAARLGTLGLAAGAMLVCGLAVQLARRLPKLRRAVSPLWPLGVGLAGLLAAMLAHGLVDHSFFLVDLAFTFMLAGGLAASLRDEPGGQAN